MTALKSAGNITVTVGGSEITSYLNQAQLALTAAELEATHLGSTGAMSNAGLVTSALDMGGDYSTALEAIIGPKVLSGAKSTTAIALVSAAITWTWTASGDVGGWVSNFTINFAANGKATWSGKLNLSGLGVRS